VAVFDCFVPSRNQREISNQADVIVWTPQTCVVIEVKGLTEQAGGELAYSANGQWTLDGRPAPLQLERNDDTPLDQVRESMSDLKHLFDHAIGRAQFVAGMVLVLPQRDSHITLVQKPLPNGMHVLLGDGPESLRGYFTGAATGPTTQWDAQRVQQAFAALDLNINMPTLNELVSEGFPPGSTVGAGLATEVTATGSFPAPSAPPAAGGAVRAPISGAPLPGRVPAPGPPKPGAASAGYKRRMYLAGGLSVALAVVAVAIITLLISGGKDRGGNQPGPGRGTSTQVNQFSPPPEPSRPQLTTATKACHPFEAGC
jgi:hypothetical protein